MSGVYTRVCEGADWVLVGTPTISFGTPLSSEMTWEFLPQGRLRVFVGEEKLFEGAWAQAGALLWIDADEGFRIETTARFIVCAESDGLLLLDLDLMHSPHEIWMAVRLQPMP